MVGDRDTGWLALCVASLGLVTSSPLAGEVSARAFRGGTESRRLAPPPRVAWRLSRGDLTPVPQWRYLARTSPSPVDPGVDSGVEFVADFMAWHARHRATPRPEIRDRRPVDDTSALRGQLAHSLSTPVDGSTTAWRSRGQLGSSAGVTPWSLDWSLDSRHGGGAALAPSQRSGTTGQVTRVALERRIADRVLVRAGRYSPGEVAVGRIDGAQAEIGRGRAIRLGALFGLRDHEDGPTPGHSVAAAYFASELGKDGSLSHRGTLGVVSSMDSGRHDRLALVARSRARLGSRLRLDSSSSIDLPTATSRRGDVALTALRVETEARVVSRVRLRSGIGHRKRPDIGSRRGADERAYTRGTWKAWAGVDVDLPGSVTLAAEARLADRFDAADRETTWRASLRRRGLFGLADASIQASIEARGAWRDEGYEWSVAGRFPLRRSLSIASRVRGRAGAPGARTLDPTEVAVDLSYRVREAVRLSVGARKVLGEKNPDARTVEVALQLVW